MPYKQAPTTAGAAGSPGIMPPTTSGGRRTIPAGQGIEPDTGECAPLPSDREVGEQQPIDNRQGGDENQ